MAIPKKSKASRDNVHAPATAPEMPGTDVSVVDEGQSPTPSRERVYRGTQEVDHDLFKLRVSPMRKNVSFTDIPEIVSFEHCHIFHTVDSNGRVQECCNDVGGHHHDIQVNRDSKGVPTLTVSPPRKWVREKRRGRFTRLSVPVILDAESGETDNHTHTVLYLGSEKIKLRTTNLEFAKYESNELARTQPAPVPGVLG